MFSYAYAFNQQLGGWDTARDDDGEFDVLRRRRLQPARRPVGREPLASRVQQQAAIIEGTGGRRAFTVGTTAVAASRTYMFQGRTVATVSRDRLPLAQTSRRRSTRGSPRDHGGGDVRRATSRPGRVARRRPVAGRVPTIGTATSEKRVEHAAAVTSLSVRSYFNRHAIGGWDVSRVADLEATFNWADDFDETTWDVSQVTTSSRAATLACARLQPGDRRMGCRPRDGQPTTSTSSSAAGKARCRRPRCSSERLPPRRRAPMWQCNLGRHGA